MAIDFLSHADSMMHSFLYNVMSLSYCSSYVNLVLTEFWPRITVASQLNGSKLN